MGQEENFSFYLCLKKSWLVKFAQLHSQINAINYFGFHFQVFPEIALRDATKSGKFEVTLNFNFSSTSSVLVKCDMLRTVEAILLSSEM